jgi:HAE1 family hydrophobic/amphiphilic exporter-1
MLISDFSIKRPIVTVAAMLAVVAFGLAALSRLKSDEFPDIQYPAVGINLAYPGAAPEAVEREILEPLEDRLASLPGIDKMQSSAFDGAAQVAVLFQFGTDPQVASQNVRDAIASIRDRLPAELLEPTLMHFDPADAPVLSLTLSSPTLDATALTRIADPTLTRALLGVPGVAQVTLFGGVTRELAVELRPDAMTAAGVGVRDVVAALQTQNIAAPVGRILGARDERSIRLRARPADPAAFAALPVLHRGGHVVRLGDVATVRDASADPRTLAFVDGTPALGLDIVKARGYSTPAVTEAIQARLAELRATLPAGLTVTVVQDAGARVSESVRGVQRALVEGAALTVLVVFLFLNSWRSTVITGLALPVSVLASFVAVWAMGFTINMMSLLGLSLAIGILIDDAIVVRENIVRHVEMGKDHLSAAREGTSEIGGAVTATTLSIVAVFIPIGFMGGLGGQWFKPFALTMASSVLVSLFVSFSLDPMLSAYWPDPHGGPRGRVTRALDRFNACFARIAERYEHVVSWALDHRLATGAIALGSLVAAVALQVTVGGSDFTPVTDRSEMSVGVEAPPGSNAAYTAQRAELAARVIRAHPEVRYTYTTVGGRAGTVDAATIYVRLVPKTARDVSQSTLGARLRAELDRIPGAAFSVYANGNVGFKQIQIEVRGPDARTLTALAARMADVVRTVPGAVDVGLSTKGEKGELQVDLDRGLAGSLGITAGDVAQALRPAFAGVDAGDWVDPDGETRDVMVRLAPQLRGDRDALARLPLVVGEGGTGGAPVLVPLGQVVTLSDGAGPAQIDHLGRDRSVTVQANVEGRPLGEVNAAIDARLAAVPMPAGYRVTQGGDGADQSDVFGRIAVALGIALLLMYLILVMQLGSFVDPLAILLSLPLSLVGAVGALILCGDTLNLISLIGVMLLMGVVAKNAILLIDFAQAERARGTPLREALVEAGRTRLRPILMTTLALVAGMLPVALGAGEGGDFYAPLGRAVIGGTITSTALTLLVIPTFYEVLEEWRARIGAWVRRPRRAATTATSTAPTVGA